MDHIDAAEGPRTNMEDKTAIHIAEKAIIMARKCLPLGPFNNRLLKRLPAMWTNYPAWQNALNESLASLFVQPTLRQDPKDFIVGLAAFAHAAKTTGGGVCTYFAALTAGIITTMAPSRTEILLVYSDVDHQFCVISCNKSPWYTVDPWTLNAYVLRWENSCFAPGLGVNGHVDNYFKITVQQRIDIPYGISFDEGVVKKNLRAAKEKLGPQTAGDMAHNFRHCCNSHDLAACGGGGVAPIEGRPAVQTYKNWG